MRDVLHVLVPVEFASAPMRDVLHVFALVSGPHRWMFSFEPCRAAPHLALSHGTRIGISVQSSRSQFVQPFHWKDQCWLRGGVDRMHSPGLPTSTTAIRPAMHIHSGTTIAMVAQDVVRSPADPFQRPRTSYHTAHLLPYPTFMVAEQLIHV